MSLVPLGIDVAKTTFTAAVWQAGRAQVLGTCANTPDGFADLAACLPQPPHLVLEPTGGYEAPLVAFACEQGWPFSLVNPKQLRDWGKGMGYRAKTDLQDACLLVHYAALCQPEPQQRLPAAVSELDSLLKRREEVEQMRQQERNRLDTLHQRPHTHPAVPASVQRHLDALDAEHQALDQALHEHLTAQAALTAQGQRLRHLPGVGPKTVLPLLVLLHRYHARTQGQGTAKGLTAFVGLDPQPRVSGTSVWHPPRISRKGDRALRRTLYLAALGGVRGDNPLRHFYRRLRGRGKAPKVALIAAARKLLSWAWALFRHQTDWDPARFALSAV